MSMTSAAAVRSQAVSPALIVGAESILVLCLLRAQFTAIKKGRLGRARWPATARDASPSFFVVRAVASGGDLGLRQRLFSSFAGARRLTGGQGDPGQDEGEEARQRDQDQSHFHILRLRPASGPLPQQRVRSFLRWVVQGAQRE